MSEPILLTLSIVLLFGCGCACFVALGCIRESVTIRIIRNPVIVVHSPLEADPEDPTDFSSNPKSSSVSVGS